MTIGDNNLHLNKHQSLMAKRKQLEANLIKVKVH